jgi:Zn finger protein HypA/HybF involved in hydrogenase expression
MKYILCTNPNCEYTWISKVEKPKCCPRCRQYIKRIDEGKLLEIKNPPNGSTAGNSINYSSFTD